MIQHNITKFHMWLLRRIVRQNIVQGPYHHNNMAAIQQVIAEESKQQFLEDNYPTQYYFLSEAMELGFMEAWPYLKYRSSDKAFSLDHLRKNWANCNHQLSEAQREIV